MTDFLMRDKETKRQKIPRKEQDPAPGQTAELTQKDKVEDDEEW